MRIVGARSTGTVIAWPGPESRPRRPAPNGNAPRCQILLFLGVRYERLEDPRSEPAQDCGEPHPPARRCS